MLFLEKNKPNDKHDLDTEKALRQQAEEEEHCGRKTVNQKGGTSESEGSGMRSDKEILLGQFEVLVHDTLEVEEEVV